jgi:glycosyltransferase involved in cell wall biosynthesis
MPDRRRVAAIYGAPFGPGGLAVQSANLVAALAVPDVDLYAVGPAPRGPRPEPPAVAWRDIRISPSSWRTLPWLRSFQGSARLRDDVRIGTWASRELARIQPQLCYSFTQVSLESLLWARRHGVPSVLESPNGHIENFRAVYVRECARWCGARYRGHPTPAMVERVTREYELADRIRVSSEWARDSLVAGGVAAGKITVLQQPVDLQRYRPGGVQPRSEGPLRVVFVGTLDLRKGFVYLLHAVRRLKGKVSVELVGGTADRCTRTLLAREARGLDVRVAPGDPLGAYHRAEVGVLPTLEDGSPFAVAEAMACGLPAIVTDSCGAREWIEPGRSGWIVRAADAETLADVLAEALRRRKDLQAMGRAARDAVERRADPLVCNPLVAQWVYQVIAA